MTALLTHGIPLILGFFAKFMALKSQDAKEIQERTLIALNAQAAEYKAVREFQTPSANAARRTILLFLVAMVSTFVLGYAVFGVPVYVEQITEAQSYLLGLITTPATTEWIKIEGIPAFKSIFSWMAMIIEFWFGAQLAKRG